MKGFGLDRVVEPKGSIPVTAWKLDNSSILKSKEMKIAINLIDFERGNFNQICSICDYDVNRIKERILKIVNERGKIHNPYTESSGLFCGTIEDISPDFELEGFNVGDDVVCMTPLAGLPLYLESIEEVDFAYGQIKCTGYAICFESVKLFKHDRFNGNDSKYLLVTLEEEGNLCNLSEEFKKMNISKALIVGSNLAEVILYARLVNDSNPGQVSIILAIDSSYTNIAKSSDVKKILGNLVDDIYFVDLGLPIEAFDAILKGENRDFMDVVLNLENIKGSESVANCIVKDGGMVCYTGINNSYSQGLLIADCLGKEVDHYALDGYDNDAYDFAVDFVEKTLPEFKMLDEFASKSDIARFVATEGKRERTQNAAKTIDDFIYMSSVTETMVEEVLNVAQYDCNVIIQGETGVGKEKVFNLIHQNSPRRGKPCIKINCATIQENLAESEFFGYERGSFTGAQASGKEGYFELANNGTLFLDEIGSLSLTMQSKLLRVLQENTYYRVGGTTPKRVNVRVVCANNIPLKKLVEEGRFREDLYYRLNICLINVPPLRMRKDDIVCLSDTFLKNYSKKYGVEKTFAKDAYDALKEYHWPGNVRELENTVHRLYIAEKGKTIDGYSIDMLLNQNLYHYRVSDLKRELKNEESLDFNKIMEEQERKLIEYALEKQKTTRAAAEFLNIPQATLARKKVKYGL
ncbi:MAG: sigma 54-interacting transcriptional regulator [Firmicutes bacterium]|nr:sigma 54-interacting transcriptional regulator [Bacillota bacterium]